MKNEQDIVAGRKGGSRNKISDKTSLFFFLSFLLCSYAFEVKRTFIALYFALPMT
jgi:hypothetical protein